MNKEIKDSHSIAWGYGCFGLMWLSIIIVLIIFPVRHYGITHPTEILSALKAASGTIIYLLVMSSVNISMALAVWRITSFSEKAQKIVFGFAIFFAVSATILLLTSIASWFFKKMPDWFSPFYNVYPAALLTLGYSYYAYLLRKLLRVSNNLLQATRE